MPLLYSYINAETDPDNLWKIQRRVAKSLRKANDDDRGLAETADMSEDTDVILESISKVLDQTINITNKFLNETSKLKRPTDIITIPDFNFKTLTSLLKEINKVDINKMNASNVAKITDANDKLKNFLGYLTANVEDFKGKVVTMERAKLGRQKADDDEEKEEGELQETKEEPSPKKKAKQREQLPVARQRELKDFFQFYDNLIKALQDLVNQLDLKLLNYRQTTAVLRDDGIEMLGSGYGGCMCPFEYSPQYQNRMFY
jgi:hypothetical protein